MCLGLAASVVPVGGSVRPAWASGSTSAVPAGSPSSSSATVELDGISNEEALLLAKIDASNAQLVQVKAAMAVTAGQLAPLKAELARAQSELGRAAAQVVSLQGRQAELAGVLDAAKVRMQSYAVQLFMASPNAAKVATLLESGDGVASEVAVADLSAVVDRGVSAVEDYRRAQAEVARQSQMARAAQSTAHSQQDVIQTKESALAAVQTQQAAQVQALQTAQDQSNALLAQARSKATQFAAQEAAVKAQSDSLTSMLAGRDPGTPPGPHAGTLRYPLPGAPITSVFGYRVDPITHVRQLHAGVDFGAPSGTPIHAAAGGVVTFAGVITGYGNATIIDLGNGLANLYGHQSVIEVTTGQKVSSGDVIGLVGSTGYSTGPHLHLELRVNGIPVDPMPYL